MNKFLFALLLLYVAPVQAKLNIFACEPEWGALAQELGADRVDIYTATTALQNPHYIEARPSLLAKARRADLVICTGAELEAGWLPIVLTQSGNAKIQASSPGFFEASSFVVKLEVPQSLDRAQGDVHAAGNPHVHLDPHNIAKIATKLTERFAQLDAANAGAYQAQGGAFQEKWRDAIAGWEARAAPLKGLPIVTYHKDMSYLINWLGLIELANLEPKPGVPPTTGHLTDLLEQLEKKPAKAIVRSAYSNPKPAQWLAERARVPAIVLPFTVGGSEQARNLYGLFDDSVARLLSATNAQ
ncbi:MAG: metal ABC transporter substrate-binding protein [Burkholderiales bacterium]